MFKSKAISALLIITFIFSFISCDKENNEDIDIQIIGDAFILKRMLNEKVQYGHVFYLYANYPLSSANVVTPEQETVTLLSSDQLSLVFSKEPLLQDYSENKPQNGIFNFNAKNNDEAYTTTDDLDFVDMDIPEITSTEYFGAAETLKVEWNTVANANSYIVRMIDVDENVIFTGYLLGEEATSYEINANTGNWLDLPVYNQAFMLEIHATRYEENVDALETYHVEEISIGEKTVFWGVN